VPRPSRAGFVAARSVGGGRVGAANGPLGDARPAGGKWGLPRGRAHNLKEECFKNQRPCGRVCARDAREVEKTTIRAGRTRVINGSALRAATGSPSRFSFPRPLLRARRAPTAHNSPIPDSAGEMDASVASLDVARRGLADLAAVLPPAAAGGAPALVALDLSRNALTSLRGLDAAPRLRSLNLF
jgi:hypothetical protein